MTTRYVETSNLLNYILSMFAVFFFVVIGPFAISSHAICELNDDVEFLHLKNRNMIVYWEERPCDPDSSVKYQTSSDAGQTWSAVKVLVASNEIGWVEDFDGILDVGRRDRLVAAFAVIEGGQGKLKVIASENLGEDWGEPALVWNISNDIPGFTRFLGCPVLTGKYSEKSRILSLLTTIVELTSEGEKAYAYIVTSLDGGQNWDAPRELGEIPTLCDD